MTLALPERTGAGRMAFFFCRALRQAGNEVLLVHGSPPPRTSILDEMTELGVECRLETGLAFPLPAVTARVAGLGREWGAEMLVGINQRDRAVALKASAKLRKPGVLSVQNRHVFHGNPVLRALKRKFYQWNVRRHTTLAICTSEKVREEMLAFGLDEGRTCVLPNAIELGVEPLSEERRAKLRAELGAGPETLLMTNVGRLDAQKAQDVLLDALARLKSDRPWRMVLVGGSSQSTIEKESSNFAEALQAQVERLGLTDRVLFAGWRDDVRDVHQAADLYVHSARWEGLSLAVLEAMACRLPIVCTDCSGRLKGFEDGRHGYIVPTEAAAPLAEAVDRVLALTGEERTRMGLGNRELAELHYDIQNVGSRFVGLLAPFLKRSA